MRVLLVLCLFGVLVAQPRVDDFNTQTEYLPQLRFDVPARPVGAVRKPKKPPPKRANGEKWFKALSLF